MDGNSSDLPPGHQATKPPRLCNELHFQHLASWWLGVLVLCPNFEHLPWTSDVTTRRSERTMMEVRRAERIRASGPAASPLCRLFVHCVREGSKEGAWRRNHCRSTRHRSRPSS